MNDQPPRSASERLVRIAALAACGATLVWLSGCGGGSASSEAEGEAPQNSIAAEIERRNAERAAKEAAEVQAAEEAEQQRLAAEGPSPITKDDFKRGSKAKEGGRVASALGGVLATGEDIQLQNIRHQLEIHGNDRGWPESHEEFMQVINGWGMKLPELLPPYEYWYNAETHEILKRPMLSRGSDEASGVESSEN